MAKDKQVEAEYKAERLRRTSLRKEKRRNNREYKKYRYGDSRDSKCPYCGGIMTWCSCCQIWSSDCCIPYGTCQCS